MAFGGVKGTLSGAAAAITNPFSATGSVVVAVGDLIVAVLGERAAAVTVTAVTDNLGNTYTAVNAGTAATSAAGRAFYSIVTTAGTLTSANAAATASTNDVAFAVVVYEGPYAVSPRDVAPANTTFTASGAATRPAPARRQATQNGARVSAVSAARRKSAV